MAVLCPVCIKEVSNWSVATGKAVKIRGVLIHLNCLEGSTIRQAEEKWEPIKAP